MSVPVQHYVDATYWRAIQVVRHDASGSAEKGKRSRSHASHPKGNKLFLASKIAGIDQFKRTWAILGRQPFGVKLARLLPSQTLAQRPSFFPVNVRFSQIKRRLYERQRNT